MARKTTRLYYGLHPETGKPLYWTLKVKNATRAVKLNGTIKDAMQGKPGLSIGCHLSNVAKANKEKFGHPVLYISFSKTGALAITKIVKGTPCACVRYRHGYGRYVDLNDTDPTKSVVRAHPELFDRQFILRPYKPGKPHHKPEYGRRETGKRASAQLARGELRRLKNAGLVHLAI